MNMIPTGDGIRMEPADRERDALEFLLEREFARSASKNRYLFTCRFTKMMRLNMRLLHLCLCTRNEKGIYVSIDHPHSYTQMALKRMNAPLDGIIYVDAISKLTGTRGEDSQVRFLIGGLTIPILDDLFSRAYLPEGAQRHFVKLEELSFILVDNVNVAIQYAGPEKVKRLMAGLADLVKKYTSMKVFLIMDPKSHPDMHQFLKTATDREMDLKDEWL